MIEEYDNSPNTIIARHDERLKQLEKKNADHCHDLSDIKIRIQDLENWKSIIAPPSFYVKYQGIINPIVTALIIGMIYYFLIFYTYINRAAIT